MGGGGSTISCQGAATDADGDLLTYSYLWSNEQTTASITVSKTDLESELSCSVTASDGTASVTSSVSEAIFVQPKSCELADGSTVDHNLSTSRTRYAAASVAWNETCQSQTQYTTCDDGTLFPFQPNNYSAETCVVTEPLNCGDTPHLSEATRTRYAAGQVAFADPEPASETQRALCTNGSLSLWSGTYTFENFTRLAPIACGDVAHDQSVTRTRFASETVAWNETCQAEVQAATCNNGNLVFSPNSYSADGCTVLPQPTPVTIQNFSVSSVAFTASQIQFLGMRGDCSAIPYLTRFYKAEVVDLAGAVVASRGFSLQYAIDINEFTTCESLEIPFIGDIAEGVYVPFSGDASSLSSVRLRFVSTDGLFTMQTPALLRYSYLDGDLDGYTVAASGWVQESSPGSLPDGYLATEGSGPDYNDSDSNVTLPPPAACGDLASGYVKKEFFYTAETVQFPEACEKGVKVTSCSNGVLSVSGPSFESCVVTGATASSSIFLDLVNPNGDYRPMETYVQVQCGDEGDRVLQMAVTNAPNGLIYLDDEQSLSCNQWAERFMYDRPYINTGFLMWQYDLRVEKDVTKIGFVENGVVVVEALVGGISGPARPSSTEENLKLFTSEPIGLAWKEACIKDAEGQCDLSGVDLSSRDLRGTDLRDVKFSGCSATNSNFSGLDLSGSNFEGCDLSGSLFLVSDLTGANLTSANMTGVNLAESNLLGAFLSNSNLTGAIGLGSDNLSSSEAGSHINLGGLDLPGLSWDSRFIMENNFSYANLEGASFQGSYMRFTNFEGANLTDANFSNSYDSNWLWQINFSNANLTRAKFIDSYLLDVNFTGANLTDAEFSGQYYQGVDGVPGSTRHVVVNFQNANMTRVKYLNREVLYGDFTGANLNCADFSGSTGVPVYGLARCEENTTGGGFACGTPGTYDTGTSCERAPINFYAELGSSQPTACPAGTVTSQVGAASPDACFCPAGSFQPEDGSCTLSPENTYSPLGATSPTACPIDFASPAGSASPDDCRSTVATTLQNLAYGSVDTSNGIGFLGVSGVCDDVPGYISFSSYQVVNQDGTTIAQRSAGGGCYEVSEPRVGNGPGNIFFNEADLTGSTSVRLRIVSEDGLFIMETPSLNL